MNLFAHGERSVTEGEATALVTGLLFYSHLHSIFELFQNHPLVAGALKVILDTEGRMLHYPKFPQQTAPVSRGF